MSASQIIFKLFPIIFFSVFLNTKDALGSSEKNTFVIDDQTKISFSIPEESFYYSNSGDELTDINSLQDIVFIPQANFIGFKPFKFYTKKIQIKNITQMTREITVIPGRHHLTSQFFLISNKKTQAFKNRPGTNSNDLSSMNPSNANFQPSSTTNFTFKAVAGESVDLYYNFQMPSKAHFIESNLLFYHTDNYQENRRFGLWLEGLS